MECLLFVRLLENDAQNMGLELTFPLDRANLLPKKHIFALQRSCFQRPFLSTLSAGFGGAKQPHPETSAR